ncbi:hypothetical protein QA601_07800 [Chitinispirillales bacterium ANBcel5]|uniref:hypothetical protein n=1 Tax=Cellulosispirillum alkaliphilum TaxID=3039283 RepID=UPI002A5803B2|nr:hypothetical protein [Chitinispirillales bacterium ANBcel5]
MKKVIATAAVLGLSLVAFSGEGYKSGAMSSKSDCIVLPSRTMTFGDAEVSGYGNDLSPIHISGMADLENGEISLNRSFKDALKTNVDREMLERAVY